MGPASVIRVQRADRPVVGHCGRRVLSQLGPLCACLEQPLIRIQVDGHGLFYECLFMQREQLEFTKTGEGLWAESRGVICKTGTDFEARF